MNSACGWYCLAFLHFINSYDGRTKDLYFDCEQFTDLFDDLSESKDHLKNEFVLKHFFRSSDPDKRKPITLSQVEQMRGNGQNDPALNPDRISEREGGLS